MCRALRPGFPLEFLSLFVCGFIFRAQAGTRRRSARRKLRVVLNGLLEPRRICCGSTAAGVPTALPHQRVELNSTSPTAGQKQVERTDRDAGHVGEE